MAVFLGGAVLMAGCATGAAPGDSVPSHRPSVVRGPSGTLDVVVREPADRGARTVRYLRVEDDAGRSVLERQLRTSPAELSAPLAAARYRVVTWLRSCVSGSCQGATEADLGRAVGICGTQVTIAAGAVARVSVDAPSDGGCAMKSG
ncbi:hypothetical protein [Amycolatopsis saalfeldensis]|nr:hypothetical protein [Amycolatopsis saalfeldensis]